MEEFMRLCGFMLSHAVWCVSRDAVLTPMAVRADSLEDARIETFEEEVDYEAAVARARECLEQYWRTSRYTAICFDGFYEFRTGEQSDALFMVARVNDGVTWGEVNLALPYRKPARGKRFSPGQPKIIGLKNISEADLDKHTQYFWEGVARHPQGGPLWDAGQK